MSAPATPALPPAPELPATEEALCALVRAAAEQRRPLLAEGGGTKRHHGPAGPQGAQRLSLARLGRVTAYEPGDMVVSVQAGVRFLDLQRRLAERGQWLPLDPPYRDATIGGVLATNSSGPRRLGHGTVKDLLLGMRVVGASGVITKSGGRVVKNVTGYDLHKLQVGAFGSLGVILEAHLKVSPRPAVSAAAVFGCDRFTDAHRMLLEVWSSALRPTALEALDAGAATALRSSAPGLPETPALAVVGIEGSRPVFERHRRELEALFGRANALTFLEGSAAERLWKAFRDVPSRRSEEIGVRIGARPHDLPRLLEPFAHGATATAALSVHVGTGIARVWFPANIDPAELGQHLSSFAQKAQAHHGYVLIESAPLGLPGRDKLPWGTVPHALGRGIKQAWDPQQILNPGRMVV
jgi:glycolate oxidase FAD binding subunit